MEIETWKYGENTIFSILETCFLFGYNKNDPPGIKRGNSKSTMKMEI
jgi:hypothetical protein